MLFLAQALAAATFVLVVVIVISFYFQFVARPERTAQTALRKRLAVPEVAAAARRLAEITLAREDRQLSAIGMFNRMLMRMVRLTTPLERALSLAGMRLTVGAVLLISALAFALVAWLATSQTGQSLAGLAAGALAGYVPFAYIKFKRRRRLRKFEEQFPEAMDLIARAMRAGHALTTGLGIAAADMPDPAGAEFRRLNDRHTYGEPLPEAMREFAERIPVVDARFFVTAVLTQRETGGNLAEILDHLAAVMRERFRVRREVQTKSAHGKMSGMVIGGMPAALALVMWFVAPDRITVLYYDPIGFRMLVAALVLQLLGVLTIRKLVQIEY